MDNDKRLAQIPFYVYEDMADRLDRTQRRLIIALVCSILAIVFLSVMVYLINKTWANVWSEFEVVADDSESISVESDGDANYIGRNGVIVNGENSGE